MGIGRNRAIDGSGEHRLTLSVNRTGIVIDQIAVVPEGAKEFYEIPARSR